MNISNAAAYEHQPVMVAEAVRMLQPRSDSIIVDGTAGGAGHIAAILEHLGPAGAIVGIDLDPDAVAAARHAVGNDKRVTIVKENYKNINKILHVHQFDKVDGILLDLGLSSNQLQDRKRGFSFSGAAPLDMRFSPDGGLTAHEIINTYRHDQLVALFKTFGEEPLAGPIAKAIVTYRQAAPIDDTETLANIISDVYDARYHKKSRINPATKVFQALRIAVNGELENISEALPNMIASLAPGGRLVVISYHSLEDRIVKNFFRTESRDCICPPDVPICQCGHVKTIRIITKKPLEPSTAEVEKNPRARSAKMRVAEKI